MKVSVLCPCTTERWQARATPSYRHECCGDCYWWHALVTRLRGSSAGGHGLHTYGRLGLSHAHQVCCSRLGTGCDGPLCTQRSDSISHTLRYGIHIGRVRAVPGCCHGARPCRVPVTDRLPLLLHVVSAVSRPAKQNTVCSKRQRFSLHCLLHCTRVYRMHSRMFFSKGNLHGFLHRNFHIVSQAWCSRNEGWSHTTMQNVLCRAAKPAVGQFCRFLQTRIRRVYRKLESFCCTNCAERCTHSR